MVLPVGLRSPLPASPFFLDSLRLVSRELFVLSLADNPFPRVGIQSLASFFCDQQSFAELQPHFFILGNKVGLDDNDHVFAKHHFLGIMTLAGFGLKDRGILIYAMDQIIIGAVAAPMNDLGSLFCFGG